MKTDTENGASSCVTPRTAGGHQAGRGRGFPETIQGPSLYLASDLWLPLGERTTKFRCFELPSLGVSVTAALGCFLNYLCSAELLTLCRAQHTRLPPWMLVWHQAGQSRDSLCLNGTFGAHPRMRARTHTPSQTSKNNTP